MASYPTLLIRECCKKNRERVVGTTGIEPVTPAMSRQCSTAELRAPEKPDLASTHQGRARYHIQGVFLNIKGQGRRVTSETVTNREVGDEPTGTYPRRVSGATRIPGPSRLGSSQQAHQSKKMRKYLDNLLSPPRLHRHNENRTSTTTE